VGISGFRGVDPASGIDLFLFMLPSIIFLPPNRTPQASSIRAGGPAQNRVAFGHFNAADIGGLPKTVLRTGSRAPSSSRAQEKRKSVSAQGADLNCVPGPPATHGTPRNPERAVIADSESPLRIPPPRGGQMPPSRPPTRPLASFAPRGGRVRFLPSRYVLASAEHALRTFCSRPRSQRVHVLSRPTQRDPH